MYYQNYEDYMRSVLGYPTQNQNTYKIKNSNLNANFNLNLDELEEYYPDIYKLINPTVCEMCNKYKMTIKRDMKDCFKDITEITEEVYKRIDFNSEVFSKNRIENRQLRTNTNNLWIKDLIKILVINKIKIDNYENVLIENKSNQSLNSIRPNFIGTQNLENKDYENYFKF